jgi:hypothetical protein
MQGESAAAIDLTAGVAIGALVGLRYAPYRLLHRYLVRPRLGPSSRTEAEAPPRFAQGVGMVFAGKGKEVSQP